MSPQAIITYLEIINTRPFSHNGKLADLYYEVHCPYGWQIAFSFSLVAFSVACVIRRWRTFASTVPWCSRESLWWSSVDRLKLVVPMVAIWFDFLSSLKYCRTFPPSYLSYLNSFSHRWQKDLAGFDLLGTSLAVALCSAGFARVSKSCLLHFNVKWKQDQLIFLAVIHSNSWASRSRYTDWNAPSLQFAHLICIFEIYLDAFPWISFAKFEINFQNPLIGCQCFDFVYPKARSVHPNWRTRLNFVCPESRSVCPGCNDVLWIRRCMCHTLGYGFWAVLVWDRVWFFPL